MRHLVLVTKIFIVAASTLCMNSMAAAEIALLDAAETSTDLYAVENKIDLSKPHAELYGYSAERHGDYARTRIFKTSESSLLDVKTYACEFSAVESPTANQTANPTPNKTSDDFQTTCWKQKPATPTFFEASLVRVSVEDMQRSATEVARLLSKEKASENAEYTLLKVWPEKSGIQVQLGYESQVIAENYVCQTQPKLSCARATTVPAYEP